MAEENEIKNEIIDKYAEIATEALEDLNIAKEINMDNYLKDNLGIENN